MNKCVVCDKGIDEKPCCSNAKIKEGLRCRYCCYFKLLPHKDGKYDHYRALFETIYSSNS